MSTEQYKWQKLRTYKISLAYIDSIYLIASELPEFEKYNLHSQIIRAATSIALNIAEGSTGQTDREQHRFLGLALRSYIETVACLDIIENRNYLTKEQLSAIRVQGFELFVKLQAFRKSLFSSLG